MTVSSNYSAYSSNSTSSVSSASQKGKPDFEKMAQELWRLIQVLWIQ
jgi:hypothetical protein